LIVLSKTHAYRYASALFLLSDYDVFFRSDLANTL
jgi:hypothetical protein